MPSGGPEEVVSQKFVRHEFLWSEPGAGAVEEAFASEVFAAASPSGGPLRPIKGSVEATLRRTILSDKDKVWTCLLVRYRSTGGALGSRKGTNRSGLRRGGLTRRFVRRHPFSSLPREKAENRLGRLALGVWGSVSSLFRAFLGTSIGCCSSA